MEINDHERNYTYMYIHICSNRIKKIRHLEVNQNVHVQKNKSGVNIACRT